MNRLCCALLASALLWSFGIWPARAASKAGASEGQSQLKPALLKFDALRNHVKTFNSEDHTHFGQAISNEDAADWMANNVPLFDCPDGDIEEIYHFRWWTFRKHIKNTPDGFVITEFLPKVNWSGKHNTISCPAGHHFREGRWIRDTEYLDDYLGLPVGVGAHIARSLSTAAAQGPAAYTAAVQDAIALIALLTGVTLTAQQVAERWPVEESDPTPKPKPRPKPEDRPPYWPPKTEKKKEDKCKKEYPTSCYGPFLMS